MADPTFDPVAGLIDPETYGKIADQWSTFLDQPGGRAALLQAGIAMSQPLAWGQSNFGAFTGALGSAGEAATRSETIDVKRQDAENRALLAEARSRASEAASGAAGTKLEAAQIKAQTAREAMQLRAWNDIRKGYETYRKNVEAENANILRTAPPTPVLSVEDWVRSQPSARSAAEAAGIFGTQGVTEPGSYATPTRTPVQALGGSGAIVDIKTPEEAMKLKPGTRYRNPAGDVYTR